MDGASDKDRTRILAGAVNVLGERGLDAVSFESVSGATGVSPERIAAHFGTRAGLLRALLVQHLSGPAEAIGEAVGEASNAEAALEAFIRLQVRHNMDNQVLLSAHLAMSDPHACRQQEWTNDLQHEHLVPANDALFGPTAAKLVEEWGAVSLPHGVNPRRLTFVAYLCAYGYSWFQSMLLASSTSGKHGDEELLAELCRALVSPPKVLRQLDALNSVATELATLRDEAALVARVPSLLCSGLDVDRALLMLVDAKGVLQLESLAGRHESPADSAAGLRAVQESAIPPPPHYRQCVNEGRSIYVHAPAEEPDWPRPKDPEIAEAFVKLHPDAPFVVTPLRVKGKVEGVLAGHVLPGGRPLDQSDLHRVETFSTLVGLALENARFYSTLQDQVAERTLELRQAQAQLVQSEKMASLARLVAGVVHEFNTPLGAIISSSQTLARADQRMGELAAAVEDASDISGKLARVARVIHDTAATIQMGAVRVQGIVQRLRAFARLDEAERDHVDLNALLRVVVDTMSQRLADTVKVETSLGDLPPVDCFPGGLNSLFLNLMENAVTAMPNGGTLTVRSWREGECVQVAVSDTGVGIEEARCAQLFEPSFSKRDGRVGASLGLATCAQIANEHGGELSVQSELGKGSTFCLRIPLQMQA